MWVCRRDGDWKRAADLLDSTYPGVALIILLHISSLQRLFVITCVMGFRTQMTSFITSQARIEKHQNTDILNKYLLNILYISIR